MPALVLRTRVQINARQDACCLAPLLLTLQLLCKALPDECNGLLKADDTRLQLLQGAVQGEYVVTGVLFRTKPSGMTPVLGMHSRLPICCGILP